MKIYIKRTNKYQINKTISLLDKVKFIETKYVDIVHRSVDLVLI